MQLHEMVPQCVRHALARLEGGFYLHFGSQPQTAGVVPCLNLVETCERSNVVLQVLVRTVALGIPAGPGKCHGGSAGTAQRILQGT